MTTRKINKDTSYFVSNEVNNTLKSLVEYRKILCSENVPEEYYNRLCVAINSMAEFIISKVEEQYQPIDKSFEFKYTSKSVIKAPTYNEAVEKFTEKTGVKECEIVNVEELNQDS